jgi:hypothetical protein
MVEVGEDERFIKEDSNQHLGFDEASWGEIRLPDQLRRSYCANL